MTNFGAPNESRGWTKWCSLKFLHPHKSWFMIIAEVSVVEMKPKSPQKNQCLERVRSSLHCQTQQFLDDIWGAHGWVQLQSNGSDTSGVSSMIYTQAVSFSSLMVDLIQTSLHLKQLTATPASLWGDVRYNRNNADILSFHRYNGHHVNHFRFSVIMCFHLQIST